MGDKPDLPALIARVRELDSEATPGPWRTGSLLSFNGLTGEPEAFIYRLPEDDDTETAHNRICIRAVWMDPVDDADLIAEYRTAAPLLATALEEQMAEVAELRARAQVSADLRDIAVSQSSVAVQINEALKTEVERLRAALRPFAHLDYRDNGVFPDGFFVAFEVPLSAIRAARAALEGKP